MLCIRSGLAVLALAAVCLACSVCSGRGSRLDARAVAELGVCVQAMDAASAERGLDEVRTLARGCSGACPALAGFGADESIDLDDVTRLLEGCHMFCSAEARAAWDQAPIEGRFAALARACGPETYGLTQKSAPLLSEGWVVLLRVHEWLERQRRGVDKAMEMEIEHAGMRAHFHLPLPARLDGVYALPAADEREGSRAAFYVIIELGEPARVRGGAVPVARLRLADLERRPVPGGEFPGKHLVSPAADYAELVRLLEGVHPGMKREWFVAEPLVLADRSVQVRALLAAVAAIEQPRFRLGVSDRTAMAHRVAIEHVSGAGGADVLLRVTADGYEILGGSEAVRVPAGHGARERMAAQLAEIASARAPLDRIELDLGPSATVSDLAAILDVLARARFRVALMRVPVR